jgi:hypothetical protein
LAGGWRPRRAFFHLGDGLGTLAHERPVSAKQRTEALIVAIELLFNEFMREGASIGFIAEYLRRDAEEAP